MKSRGPYKRFGFSVHDHPLYDTWCAMKARCFNSNNPAYRNYGGRGITVCDRWRNSFYNFINDVGERPNGLSLDRINNDGNYEPNNVRWATSQQQQKNARFTEFKYQACLKGVKIHAERKRSMTHCLRGHELTESNVRYKPNGTRQCRLCDKYHNNEGRRLRKLQNHDDLANQYSSQNKPNEIPD